MDSAAGGGAWLNCCEVINADRTCAYMKAGIKPAGLQVYGDCCNCGHIRELAECDTNPYVSPMADPAPWYDPSIPESADFGGFFPTEFNGLSSTATRGFTEVIGGGAVLGRVRYPPRTLTWRGYLVGRTCCSVAFGLRWLTSQLLSTGCDGCSGADLDVLVCCPDATDPTECPCTCLATPSLPAPGIVSNANAFRTLKNVGLLNGPTIISERTVGCGCGAACVTEIEFSLIAGKPWLYKKEIDICTIPLTDPKPCLGTNPETGGITFVKKFPGDSIFDCDTRDCPEAVDCAVNPKAGCEPPTIPQPVSVSDNCAHCEPLDKVVNCCAIDKTLFGVFFEGVIKVEIYAGKTALQGATIQFYENPLGLPCDQITNDRCFACDQLDISYIPANSTLTLDGTTRQITLDCPGLGADVPADNLTTSPFKWPVLSCIDYCVCVTVDGQTVAPDATFKISLIPREN